jgi:hypothetical protein
MIMPQAEELKAAPMLFFLAGKEVIRVLPRPK